MNLILRIKEFLYRKWLKRRNKKLYNSDLMIRTFDVKVPKSTKIMGKVNLICTKDAEISLGENVTLRSDPFDYFAGMPFKTTLLVDRENGRIVVGDNCRINGAYLHAKKNITIGKNCLIAAGTNILDSNGHQLVSTDRTQGEDEPKEIVIGNNVWLCLNSIILKGTKIGHNSVVTANSVVKGEFPDNSVLQGNPAVVVSTLPIEEC
jgi:acetyltransferase-like isoleucine patch superfamily enzyme